jgi:hypothetical protein
MATSESAVALNVLVSHLSRRARLPLFVVHDLHAAPKWQVGADSGKGCFREVWKGRVFHVQDLERSGEISTALSRAMSFEIAFACFDLANGSLDACLDRLLARDLILIGTPAYDGESFVIGVPKHLADEKALNEALA